MVTGAAAAGLLTGCSSEESERGRTAGSTRGSASDSASDSARAQAALRRRLAAVSGALRDQYDDVIAQHPALAGQLAQLRTAVAEHATALAGKTVAPAAARVAVPAEAAAALKALAAAERRTSEAHTASLLDAEPELARLLASVAAAGATHAYLLTKGDSR